MARPSVTHWDRRASAPFGSAPARTGARTRINPDRLWAARPARVRGRRGRPPTTGSTRLAGLRRETKGASQGHPCNRCATGRLEILNRLELQGIRERRQETVDPVVAGSSPVVLAQLSQALAAGLDRRSPARIGRRCLNSASCVIRVAPCGKPGAGRPPRVHPPRVRSSGATPMANLGKKGGAYHVRFRFRGKEYKKSLKTRDESAARGALHLIELTLHRLHTGQLHVPDRVDPGDFVVSGGTLRKPVRPRPAAEPGSPLPSTRQMFALYTAAQQRLLARPTTPARPCTYGTCCGTSAAGPTTRATRSRSATSTASSRPDWPSGTRTLPSGSGSPCYSSTSGSPGSSTRRTPRPPAWPRSRGARTGRRSAPPPRSSGCWSAAG